MANFLTNKTISRRALLRGAGASLALPFLDAMIPAAKASTPANLPKRFAWIYIPNGVVQEAWHPQSAGADWEVTPSLQPLAGLKQHINVFSGLDREFRGGTGVHAQAGCCWLTSSAPSEALDGGFPTNTSLDQIVARKSSGETLLPSLELSCNDHANQKETRYFESLAWYGPGYAANVVKNPADVYARLFDKPDPATGNVLDVILEDARRLQRSLGAADKQKLGEYLESVRSVEERIEKADALASSRRTQAGSPSHVNRPQGIPDDRGAYLRLMGDLMAIAFQQDLTRVATLLIDPERWDTPRMYHGVFATPQNHHVFTHTRGDEAKESLQKIDHFHVEQFAYLVRRLSEIKEGDGSLLDNCLISFGSGMGDGRVHDYNNLPLITAGRAGGAFKTGSHYKYDGKVPLANVWLTVLHSLGDQRAAFADSTGTLSDVVK
jgi:hypothetical protein